MDEHVSLLTYNKTTHRWEGEDPETHLRLWMSEKTFERYVWRYLSDQHICQPLSGDVERARQQCRQFSYWQGCTDRKVHWITPERELADKRKENEVEANKKNGYVLDPESPTELARLIMLDRAITTSMGGIMVGIPSDLVLHNALDLACGPGGWVLDMAFEHPGVEVAGVDISQQMISYAYARARTQQLPNASFGVMDITEPLDFGDGTFDVINARFLVGVLKGAQWSALLSECFRLLRPGGVIRLVESDGLVISTSTSLTRLQQYLLRAMQGRGYGFAVQGGETLGITPLLPRMLAQAGFEPHSLPWMFDFSSTSPHSADGLHLCEVVYQLAAQQHLFDDQLRERGESVDFLIRDMLIEMQQTDFCALNYGLTVSAVKPM